MENFWRLTSHELWRIVLHLLAPLVLVSTPYLAHQHSFSLSTWLDAHLSFENMIYGSAAVSFLVALRYWWYWWCKKKALRQCDPLLLKKAMDAFAVGNIDVCVNELEYALWPASPETAVEVAKIAEAYRVLCTEAHHKLIGEQERQNRQLKIEKQLKSYLDKI